MLDLFERARLYVDAIAPPFWLMDEPERAAQVAKVVLPGDRPNTYYEAAPQLHAQTFVLTLRTTGLLLDAIKVEAESILPDLARISQQFDISFPSLKHLRDSIAHMDERLRGRNRKKRIVPKEAAGITIGGGVMIFGMLHNNSLGWTLADGSYGECEISERTLRIAVEHCEEAMKLLRDSQEESVRETLDLLNRPPQV